MDAISLLLSAAIGWVFAGYLLWDRRRSDSEALAGHTIELARRDTIIEQLVAQAQLNAQNMPYYPTLTPPESPLPIDASPLYDDGMGFLSITQAEIDALEAELGGAY